MPVDTCSLTNGKATCQRAHFEDSQRIASEFLSPLPGSSLSCLVKDEQGQSWVVKMLCEWQTPLVSFSEALATELMATINLPCPPWCVMTLDREELLQNPAFRAHQAESNYCSDYYFASRYVPDLPGHRYVTETHPIVPSGTAYRDVLVGAYVFDVWTANRDRRQMLSALTDKGAAIYLFDNSHLFGRNGKGIVWRRSDRPRSCFLGWIADQRGSARRISRWISIMQERCPIIVDTIAQRLPAEWSDQETEGIKKKLLLRLSVLKELVLLEQSLRHSPK